MPPFVLEALVAAGFAVLGWFGKTWVDRQRAAKSRAEEIAGLHAALRAEVAVSLSQLGDDRALIAHRDRVVAMMRENQDFVPFVPSELDAMFLDAFRTSFGKLPRATFDPVAVFYAQARSLAVFAEDLRSDAIQRLSQDRRLTMYEDYIEMKRTLRTVGSAALDVLDAYERGGDGAARREASRIAAGERRISFSAATPDLTQ